MDLIHSPWHWSFSGAMIALIMLSLILAGKRFGVSSSFKAVCSATGLGKFIPYFNYNWKDHDWLMLFVVGSILGGYIGSSFMGNAEAVQISEGTITHLSEMGIAAPIVNELAPSSLFSFDNLSLKTIGILIFGGILIGFGTRYAGGCTSGHAISGLSNLQLPSLVAVIGFFVGGLFMTYVLMPNIL